ncbi:flagellar motor switch phosphatase FliY [Alicyclobacillus fastidiosus]|uniref:Flagellar motor switch phosphatase FliY n=1 Tax=Alicyclobacillus fastidiosus TaxID=392011 RepID=A0ABY6ZQC0_9BACL|nr:flagellar motor switch phosphatase FliY [Alicyclobacillus fastidiosus]WAH44647.1 flagellar motor switch phosphatase FliY [Alicyclobacillus fastidiosus]
MKLSQEEIDALLSGGNPPTGPTELLSPEEADTLGEIGNISFGSAATSLSTLLQHRVDITTPTVTIIDSASVKENFPQPYVMVAVEFTEGLLGSNALAIELNDAKTIADLMMGGDGTNVEGELNELHLSAVGEAMNQMMGGAATSMSQMLGRYINISPPTVEIIDFSTPGSHSFVGEGEVVNVQFQLKVGDLIDSRIMQLLPLSFARDMVSTLLMGPVPENQVNEVSRAEAPTGTSVAAQTLAAEPMAAARVEPAVVETVPSVSAAHGAYSAMASAPAAKSEASPQNPIHVRQPEFADFDDVPVSTVPPRNLSLLFDVPLNVTVELGRAKKMVREILELGPGSILELDKLAGEPVDILVNNKRIAIGEVVVIDENFGVRVTDIISQDQRVTKLS